MARISIYGLDVNLSLLDKWIGTDSSGGVTKNFTARAISDLFNSANAISISGQNNFKFQTDSSIGRTQGTISFENFNGNNTAFADIAALKISKKSTAQKDTDAFINTLVGNNIIISHLSEPNNFGIYKLVSYTEDPLALGYYVMELEFIASNGTIQSNEYYGVAVFPDFTNFVNDKFYTHNQLLPSDIWTVEHNLGKFPSVTVVLPSGKVGFGDVQYIDENNLTITFAGDETGKAYIN